MQAPCFETTTTVHAVFTAAAARLAPQHAAHQAPSEAAPAAAAAVAAEAAAGISAVCGPHPRHSARQSQNLLLCGCSVEYIA